MNEIPQPQQQIIFYCQENLNSIGDLLTHLSIDNYQKKESWLFGSSIGQHCRHILEFYNCLIQGKISGVVDYDNRERDPTLESSPQTAIEAIAMINNNLSNLSTDTAIGLKVNNPFKEKNNILIPSTIGRELIYCLEHSIHHQALIKVGLKALNIEFLVDYHFGVAPATIRYQNAQK